MVNPVDPRLAYGRAGTASAERFDAGLRAYMLSVYNTMAGGVALTGLVSYGLYASGLIDLFYSPAGGATMLGLVAIFAPLVLVMLLSFRIQSMSESSAKAMFWGYAALVGVSLSSIFIRYAPASIAVTFASTTAAFAGLSLYGYTTKRSLSGLGTFLIMGLIGLIVAMLLNALLLHSAGMSLVISMAGVLIFAGLTAYDTQKIKNMYDHVASTDYYGKSVIMGALTLYLDFINLFLFLLRFTGGRR